MTLGPDTVGQKNPAGATPGTAIDPLVQLQFRVEVQGVVIGHFAECSGLSVEWETLEYAEGGNNAFVHGLRGRVRYRNLVMGRGLTDEDALLKWFFDYQASKKRPHLTVSVADPMGKDVRRFAFAAAYPVRWTGPELHVEANRGGNETLEIGHEGLVP